MNDDIVTRLREGEKWHQKGYVEVPSGFYEFLANEIERERSEAADEIERLRADLETARTIIRRGVPEQLQDEMSHLLHELYQLKFEKAVRGD